MLSDVSMSTHSMNKHRNSPVATCGSIDQNNLHICMMKHGEKCGYGIIKIILIKKLYVNWNKKKVKLIAIWLNNYLELKAVEININLFKEQHSYTISIYIEVISHFCNLVM